MGPVLDTKDTMEYGSDVGPALLELPVQWGKQTREKETHK